jgi:Domain of unknown function (DUF4352)
MCRTDCGIRRFARVVASAVAFLATWLLLAACGSTTQTVVKTVTTPSSADTTPTAGTTTTDTTATPSASAGLPACADLIRRHAGPGMCQLTNGLNVHFARRGTSLHLASLAADALSTRITDSVSSSYASKHAHGRYIVITLRIANRQSSPANFDSIGTTQTLLIGHNAQFSEAFEAENGPDQQSCVASDTTPIQPGESTTCDVIFDVPVAAANRMRTHGAALVVTNFGEDVGSGGTTGSGLIDFGTVG